MGAGGSPPPCSGTADWSRIPSFRSKLGLNSSYRPLLRVGTILKVSTACTDTPMNNSKRKSIIRMLVGTRLLV